MSLSSMPIDNPIALGVRLELIGLLLALIYAALRYYLYPKDRRRNNWFAYAAALCWPVNMAVYVAVNSASQLRPWKYDLYVYAVDRRFGQPSFVLGRIVTRTWYVHDLVAVAYMILPLVMVGLFAAYLWGRSQPESVEVIRAFVLNLALCLPAYLLLPVCGPRYAFPGYPALPDHVVVRPVLLMAPPNGVPSIHFSSALLIWWYARHWLWGRIFGSGFLLLTILATLGLGEHYLFDLLAAVPYTFLIWHLARVRRNSISVASENLCPVAQHRC